MANTAATYPGNVYLQSLFGYMVFKAGGAATDDDVSAAANAPRNVDEPEESEVDSAADEAADGPDGGQPKAAASGTAEMKSVVRTLDGGCAPYSTKIWQNKDYIKADDTSYASRLLGAEDETNILVAHQFGFSFPLGTVINGIVVEYGIKSSEPDAIKTADMMLTLTADPGDLDAVAIGVSKRHGNDYWPTGDITNWVEGSSTDKWGYSSITAGEIAQDGFGVMLKAENLSDDDATAYVDYIRVTIYYT